MEFRFYILSIRFDKVQQSKYYVCSVQITFRQQWFDNRLMFDDMDGKIKYLTMTESDKVRLFINGGFFSTNGIFHKLVKDDGKFPLK